MPTQHLRRCTYDDNDSWPPRSPVAMWFDDTILDDFLKDWAAVQKKLYAGGDYTG